MAVNKKTFIDNNDITLSVCLYICEDKNEVQGIIKKSIGYLPCDCSDVFWIDNDNNYMLAIRKDANMGRVAHEIFHLVIAHADLNGYNPNDYELIKPKSDKSYQYIPAELCAKLIEDIMGWVINKKE